MPLIKTFVNTVTVHIMGYLYPIFLHSLVYFVSPELPELLIKKITFYITFLIMCRITKFSEEGFYFHLMAAVGNCI